MGLPSWAFRVLHAAHCMKDTDRRCNAIKVWVLMQGISQQHTYTTAAQESGCVGGAPAGCGAGACGPARDPESYWVASFPAAHLHSGGAGVRRRQRRAGRLRCGRGRGRCRRRARGRRRRRRALRALRRRGAWRRRRRGHRHRRRRRRWRGMGGRGRRRDARLACRSTWSLFMLPPVRVGGHGCLRNSAWRARKRQATHNTSLTFPEWQLERPCTEPGAEA